MYLTDGFWKVPYYYIYLYYFILFYLRTRLLARGMRAGSKMERSTLGFLFLLRIHFWSANKKIRSFGRVLSHSSTTF